MGRRRLCWSVREEADIGIHTRRFCLQDDVGCGTHADAMGMVSLRTITYDRRDENFPVLGVLAQNNMLVFIVLTLLVHLPFFWERLSGERPCGRGWMHSECLWKEVINEFVCEHIIGWCELVLEMHTVGDRNVNLSGMNGRVIGWFLRD